MAAQQIYQKYRKEERFDELKETITFQVMLARVWTTHLA